MKKTSSLLGICVLFGLAACGGSSSSSSDVSISDTPDLPSTPDQIIKGYFDPAAKNLTVIKVDGKEMAIYPTTPGVSFGGGWLTLDGAITNDFTNSVSVSGDDYSSKGIRFGIVKDGNKVRNFALGENAASPEQIATGGAIYDVVGVVTKSGSFADKQLFENKTLTADFAGKTLKGDLHDLVKIDAKINGNTFEGNGAKGGFFGVDGEAVTGVYNKDKVQASFGGIKK